MHEPYSLAATAASTLVDALGAHRTVVVTGSGWSEAARRMGEAVAGITLTDLPGGHAPTVGGHTGTLTSVRTDVGAEPVLVAAGRVHLYEGHDTDAVVHLVRTAVLAGCTTVVLANAAGSLRPDLAVGSVALLSDHLNLTGRNPMTGPAPPAHLPSRFVDLTDLYDPALREAVRHRCPDLGEGVYAGLLGGSFETPAEIRMLDGLGADLVGMSTVLEAIAARHLGARVLGLSLVTNAAAGLATSVDHLEVLDEGERATPGMARVLTEAVAAAAS